MEFDVRDWLLVIGPVFIVGVLVHGYWRMRSNRNTLKMALDKTFLTDNGDLNDEDKHDLSFFKAELPNGGARLVSDPEQVALDLNEEVPVLMDPVEMGDASPADRRIADRPKAEINVQRAPARDRVRTVTESSQKIETSVDEQVSVSDSESTTKQRPGANCPERFVILYVAAIHGPFEGQHLLECLLDQGMTFGEMDIFHRTSDAGKILFSSANAVAPGTFVVSEMHQIKTPAISLFMQANLLNDPLAAYDQMVEVAQNLALDLVGEVKDESRSVLTPQTIEHGRQSLVEFVHRYYR
ncbi:cell division protein ZipA [Pseudomonadales bacterium]|nr:cell division protein ZipA [Pseudomonadales bacterium]MDC0994565.1 cell division protein ZipA [Pseudomonadales bacterium]MDG1001799.1 cell division protein ZipA [Pseudomonadales bacterium]